MTTKPLDIEVKSAFVVEMEAAIERRLAAAGWPDKAAVDREIRDIIRKYLGRDAWQAMVDAEDVVDDVPRDTTRDRICQPRRGRVGRTTGRYSDSFDHKLAQAGDRGDDE